MELAEFGNDLVVGGGDKKNAKGNCRLLVWVKNSIVIEKERRNGVVDGIMLPLKLSMSQSPKPVNFTLHGKRDFQDVTKLKPLR